MTQKSTVWNDNPIRNEEDDLLGRVELAKTLAHEVLGLDRSEGLVVGILGPWGSGKTSFMNLVRREIEQEGVPILDFNPWMFSGAKHLVDSFFSEISAQLRVRPGLAEIGKSIEEYGEIFGNLEWLPLIGGWIEKGRKFSQLAGPLLRRRQEGSDALRQKLEKLLRAIDKPILVILDDIDRMPTGDIREIFKLVRLTANLPNIVYLLAFDRARVEAALEEDRIPGREYLEKILQLTFDLPAIPQQVLDSQIFTGLSQALEGLESKYKLDNGSWGEIFPDIIRPLVRSIRDVRRFTIAARGTLKSLDGQVSLADTLGLEAIRLFMPDVFARLAESAESLTMAPSQFEGAERKEVRTLQINAIEEAAGPRVRIAQNMLRILFPISSNSAFSMADFFNNGTERTRNPGHWLRERQVSHIDVLRLYLERTTSKDFKIFLAAERAWGSMASLEGLASHLGEIDPDDLQNAIGILETYEDKFQHEHIVPGIVALMNILPTLPERRKDIFDLGPKLTTTRVCLRLLRTLDSAKEVEAKVETILPQINSLYGKHELIDLVGYHENAGHRLVSVDAWESLQRDWRKEVRRLPVSLWLDQWELLWILYFTNTEAAADEQAPDVPNDPRCTLKLLREAKVKNYEKLYWKALVTVYGCEETLRDRIASLKILKADAESEIIILAEKYVAGWHPEPF